MTYQIPPNPIDSTVKAIDSVATPADLQAVVDKAFNSLSGAKQGIEAELAHIAPLIALLSPPTTLSAIVTWIGSFITGVIEPMVLSQASLNLQRVELTTSVAKLTDAVARAEARVGGSIKIPTL